MDVAAPGPCAFQPPAETERVVNQPPPLQDYNLYDADFALQEGVLREGAGSWTPSLRAWGAQTGTPELIALGMLAERNPPVLHTHDRWGRRRDEVEFHPAYHTLMALGFEQGLHAAPWAAPAPGAQVARAAAFMMHGQVDNGTQCPLTMTFAAAPVLARHADSLPEVAATWLPRVHSRRYDPAFAPVPAKRGATLGMGMTEKQGGSDVRANTTRAEPMATREPGQPYRLTGHKWFFSAPMCDGFLVLANAPGGLSCFLLPRFHDGALQPGVRLQRLKEKLGNRSNASAEVEFAGAIAWLVGDEGRGVLCSRLVVALQGALLVMHAPQAVADGFCASRIAAPPGAVFGALPAGCDLGAIITRAWPEGVDRDLEAPPLAVPGPH